MIERILISALIVLLGVSGYRLLLMAQQRRAEHSSHQLDQSAGPVLVVFTSPTCAPCKLQQLPIAERLIAELGNRVKLQVVDVTEQPEVAKQYGVWSLPTTLVLDAEHKLVALNQGVTGKEKLRAQLVNLD